jgi:L-ascorbate metabolism protein UlaG (beta-lactamase superfamily)
MEIKFHGQSCFEITAGDAVVLTDPFLAPHNPVAVASADDVEPTVIAISHGHADHIADAVAVATRTGAQTVALVEIAGWLGEQGVENVSDPNFGGTVRFDWGWIKYVPAWHTNTLPDGTVIGNPAGMLINIDGKTIYHTGDTCLFGDMKLIAERNPVDILMLPIGGHYTMDRHDAVVAAQFVAAETVIPMHFNTFPPIETDAAAFKADVEAAGAGTVVVLEPGETHSA